MTQYRHFDTRPGTADGVRVYWRQLVAADHTATPLDWMDEKDPDNAKRIQAWRDGDWHFIGVQAEATVHVIRNGVGREYTLTSPGLWGIESDSGVEYLRDVFEEEKSELVNDLKAFGAIES